MKNKEFNLLLKSFNIQYRDIFDYIPKITDYSCTQSEYIEALKKAIETKTEISDYLTKVIYPDINNYIV